METTELFKILKRHQKRFGIELDDRQAKYGKNSAEDYFIKGSLDTLRMVMDLIDPQDRLAREMGL